MSSNPGNSGSSNVKILSSSVVSNPGKKSDSSLLSVELLSTYCAPFSSTVSNPGKTLLSSLSSI